MHAGIKGRSATQHLKDWTVGSQGGPALPCYSLDMRVVCRAALRLGIRIIRGHEEQPKLRSGQQAIWNKCPGAGHRLADRMVVVTDRANRFERGTAAVQCCPADAAQFEHDGLVSLIHAVAVDGHANGQRRGATGERQGPSRNRVVVRARGRRACGCIGVVDRHGLSARAGQADLEVQRGRLVHPPFAHDGRAHRHDSRRVVVHAKRRERPRHVPPRVARLARPRSVACSHRLSGDHGACES